ncbi:hypothetical protein QC762_0078880 [Podospora pseudocomata]|uniref:Uncharacterized protein n=1 Tax=Podospora pseudocomata TaxID=2093779 RepID=A0ABR0GB97_9PEZI|nr:hypothetical protein QC762_0078880 [Podospora pseudocomata]
MEFSTSLLSYTPKAECPRAPTTTPKRTAKMPQHFGSQGLLLNVFRPPEDLPVSLRSNPRWSGTGLDWDAPSLHKRRFELQ